MDAGDRESPLTVPGHDYPVHMQRRNRGESADSLTFFKNELVFIFRKT